MSFKKWAYEIPKFDEKFWNKVDYVLDYFGEKVICEPIDNTLKKTKELYETYQNKRHKSKS